MDPELSFKSIGEVISGQWEHSGWAAFSAGVHVLPNWHERRALSANLCAGTPETPRSAALPLPEDLSLLHKRPLSL